MVPEGRLHVAVLGAGRYRVTGGRAPHIVTIGATTAHCDCADRHFRQRRCKHLTAVIDYLLVAPPSGPSAGPGLETDVPPPEPESAA